MTHSEFDTGHLSDTFHRVILIVLYLNVVFSDKAMKSHFWLEGEISLLLILMKSLDINRFLGLHI